MRRSFLSLSLAQCSNIALRQSEGLTRDMCCRACAGWCVLVQQLRAAHRESRPADTTRMSAASHSLASVQARRPSAHGPVYDVRLVELLVPLIRCRGVAMQQDSARLE